MLDPSGVWTTLSFGELCLYRTVTGFHCFPCCILTVSPGWNDDNSLPQCLSYCCFSFFFFFSRTCFISGIPCGLRSATNSGWKSCLHRLYRSFYLPIGLWITGAGWSMDELKLWRMNWIRSFQTKDHCHLSTGLVFHALQIGSLGDLWCSWQRGHPVCLLRSIWSSTLHRVCRKWRMIWMNSYLPVRSEMMWSIIIYNKVSI